MGHMDNGCTGGNGVQGVWGTGLWGTWAMGTQGEMGTGHIWGREGTVDMGNGTHWQWGTGAIGYR